MRDFALALAVCLALVGCDSGSSSSSSSGGGAKTDGGAAKMDGGAKADSGGSKVAKHPWGSFKKGSFVKMKTVSEMEVGGNKMKTEMTMTQTLKDLTADEAVVETETVIPNVPTPTKSEMKLPLKAPEGAKGADGPKPKTGSEEIEVGGKKLKCNWTEVEMDAGGQKMVSKTWTNEDVPGFTVKMVSKGATSTTTMEMVEYSSK